MKWWSNLLGRSIGVVLAPNANIGRTVKHFFLFGKRFFFCQGWYYLLCLFRDEPKKKRRVVVAFFFFDVTFSRFIRSRSGSKCLLGLTGCLVLSTTILSIQSFFFENFFFFVSCCYVNIMILIGEEKKAVERNELLLE